MKKKNFYPQTNTNRAFLSPLSLNRCSRGLTLNDTPCKHLSCFYDCIKWENLPHHYYEASHFRKAYWLLNNKYPEPAHFMFIDQLSGAYLTAVR